MPVKIKASDLARTLTSKHKFVPIIDRSIAKHDYDWEFKYEPKEKNNAWHPSGDCTPSLLDLYYMAKDRLDPDVFSSPPSLSLRKTFMTGHYWHQWLQFHAVKAGLCDSKNIERSGTRWWGKPIHKVRKEDVYYGRAPKSWYLDKEYSTFAAKSLPTTKTTVVEPKPFHWARGSADIAPAQAENQDWVIDFKSMNSTDFKLQNPPERFIAKWECQVNIYMDFFDYERACIIPINKENGEMKEFIYHRNQPLIDAIYHKWEMVSQCLEEDIRPPEDEYVKLPLKGTSE